VTNGIAFYNQGNLSSSEIVLGLNDTIIRARTRGVSLIWLGAGNEATITATNATILGGLGGVAGEGVYINGSARNAMIADSAIGSAAGDGFKVEHDEGGWVSGYDITFRNSSITNCAGDGIEMRDKTFVHWQTPPVRIFLDRVRLTGNAGCGLYRRHDGGNNDITGGDRTMLYATNCLIAGNGSRGIYMDGKDLYQGAAGNGGQFIVQLVNLTLADNGGDGFYLVATNTRASTVTNYNCVIAGNTGNGLVAIHNVDAAGPVIAENYNDFFGNTGNAIVRTGTGGTTYPSLGANSLAINPQFSASVETPYRPAFGNDVLDSGNPANYPPVDILGTARPDGVGPSMGAYETAIPPPAGTVILLR
jgi:hypothetical protein